MASIEDREPLPGSYQVVIVGSGPGALQSSYCLKRLGIGHAVITRDEHPGGMFQRFPVFDRLISWTKLSPPYPRSSRHNEWFDWNSLLVDRPEDHVGVDEFMDGTSEFPSRAEMEASLVAFAARNQLPIRYKCPWEGTTRLDDGFVLHTPDGDFQAKVCIFAVGMTQPWKPEVPGIEDVPHYMQIRPLEEYKDKRIYLMGKGASAFEIADGLMHVARSLVLSSPHEVRPSVIEHSLGGVRARYMQPLEDAVFGGRTVTILDASTESISRTSNGCFKVRLSGTTRPWEVELEVDEAISATGVSAPLNDLPDIGVETFFRGGRLPAQTPFWESATVPGIYFSGSITQGSRGIRKNAGVGAVHGFRYNARIQAIHIAQKHFGLSVAGRTLEAEGVGDFLLQEATSAPELWNQMLYLARVVSYTDEGPVDDGIVPLSHFVDSTGPDAVAVAVAFDASGRSHPVVYVRKANHVEEHFLPSDEFLDFTTPEHRAQLKLAMEGL